MIGRSSIKIGIVCLLSSLCLLLLLGGALLLSADINVVSAHESTERYSLSAMLQVTSTAIITVQVTGTATITPTGTITTAASATMTPISGTVATPTHTPTITQIPSETPTPTATASATPSETPTGTPTFTPTPVVTSPPTATPVSAPALLKFQSEPVSITQGDEVVLSWDIVGATAIMMHYDSVQEVIPISTTTFAHSPLITTVYTLTIGSSGGSVSRLLTVGVSPKIEPDPAVFESPLNAPVLESPLEPPAEIATRTPEPTETPLIPTSTPTPLPTSTFTPTPSPSPSSTPRLTATDKPIGLTLTPLSLKKSVDGTDSGLTIMDTSDQTTGLARAERLRFVWYYALLSLCVLLPLLFLSLAALFWLLGDRQRRNRVF